MTAHLFTRIAASMDADSQRLLYRVAQAYYDEDLTQQQIARRFGLSRPKVSRLLQRAQIGRASCRERV